jgi:hypothetical protein
MLAARLCFFFPSRNPKCKMSNPRRDSNQLQLLKFASQGLTALYGGIVEGEETNSARGHKVGGPPGESVLVLDLDVYKGLKLVW